MAKRFTDTDKWKRPWFSELSLHAKIAWIYLLDDCDHRGVWSANFKRVSFDLGFKVDATKLNTWFGEKLVKIEKDKYFIKSFLDFQYPGGLNPNNNAHKSVLTFLANYRDKLGADQCLESPLTGAQDKDKDKDTDKVLVKDKVKEKEDSIFKISDDDLEALYKPYPRKEGKSDGFRKLRADLKTPKEVEDFKRAVAIYNRKLQDQNTKPEFVKLFSSFVSHWRDCLDEDYGTSLVKDSDPFAFFEKEAMR